MFCLLLHFIVIIGLSRGKHVVLAQPLWRGQFCCCLFWGWPVLSLTQFVVDLIGGNFMQFIFSYFIFQSFFHFLKAV